MKRYKVDFNNGKVFEAEDSGECVHILGMFWNKKGLENVGATITEIEEPRKEFFVCWDYGLFKHGFEKSDPMANMNWEFKLKVVEQREGEIIVDKDKLEKAYVSAGFGPTQNIVFEKLCKELGF
jgi:hypothetical protein